MDIQGRTSPKIVSHSALLATLIGLAAGVSPVFGSASSQDFSQVEVERIESSKLYFKNAKGLPPPPPLETGLGQIQVLAHLTVSLALEEGAPGPSGIGTQLELNAAPWLLLLAQPCRSCSGDERDLFLVRPSTGEIHEINHPGKIVDPKTGALVHESRAFYGRCVEGKKAGVFVFQREKVDRKNRLASSFYSAEATPHILRESLQEKGFPSLKRTLARVKSGDCKEISGRNRRISGKVFDIKASRLALTEGVEMNPDEETEDENDPNLRRATVGSEAGADLSSEGGSENSPEGDSETDAADATEPPSSGAPAGTPHAADRKWSTSQGARVASPELTAQELKNRITSPIGKGSPNKRGAPEPKRL